MEFFATPDQLLVARLNRSLAAASLKGGAIGAAKTNTVFEQTADAIAAALASSGSLRNRMSN
ncbi:hypothetical protein [Arthrobacter sp. 35W]|uniref:hypothetical protein n=1 Tax=Arthrobacter sp. 35W TaxID=1132441 RepID=UPI000478961F|nr:hypothetical protein [Arthrobacter sp. 35W]